MPVAPVLVEGGANGMACIDDPVAEKGLIKEPLYGIATPHQVPIKSARAGISCESRASPYSPSWTNQTTRKTIDFKMASVQILRP